MIRQFFTLAAVLAAAHATAGSLSADEQRMVDWIDAHADEAVALLEETVNVPSGTMNVEGVRELGVVMRRELDLLGLQTEWIEMPPEVQRAGHLVGRKSGTGPKFLLIGHLDTVFEPADGHRPFVRDGNIARGHGIADMKAGNVVIVYALKALAAIGALDHLPVVAYYTGDEEDFGLPLEMSRGDLIEAGQWADIALGFEGAVFDEGKDWATVARRSSSSWTLTVEGRQAHSSTVFSDEVGAGAIFEASRILHRFYDEVRGPEYLTFNAGTIQGGTIVEYDPLQASGTTFGKTNVVPNKVVVHGGIRTISQEQLDEARALMREIASENLPQTSAHIEFEDGYPPMAPTEGNVELRRQLSDINVALGRGEMPPLDPSKRGAADISFVAPYTDSLAGMGGMGGGSHTPDEYIELSSLPLAIKRAALLIYRESRR
jgi:glutamate carboxypeptidase